jgi:hypothetical protein
VVAVSPEREETNSTREIYNRKVILFSFFIFSEWVIEACLLCFGMNRRLYLEKLPAGIRKIFFSARYFIMAHFVGWGKQRRENDNNAIARHINQSECRCVRV